MLLLHMELYRHKIGFLLQLLLCIILSACRKARSLFNDQRRQQAPTPPDWQLEFLRFLVRDTWPHFAGNVSWVGASVGYSMTTTAFSSSNASYSKSIVALLSLSCSSTSFPDFESLLSWLSHLPLCRVWGRNCPRRNLHQIQKISLSEKAIKLKNRRRHI